MNPWESYYTSNEPLFRVGRVPVHVTTLIVAIQVIAMVGIALIGFSSPLISQFVFSSDAIRSGRLWTLVTYAFVDYLDFFTVLSLVFFYMFGLRVEMRLGTKRYVRLLVALILGPTIILTLLGLFGDPITSVCVSWSLLFGSIPGQWSGQGFKLNG